MSLPPLTVDIVIVNWNAGIHLQHCMKSIAESAQDGYKLDRVILVDNASSDGSSANLPSFKLPLDVLQNQTNVGFGAACNQGARGSTADYVLFLNPDTRLDLQALSKSVAFMSLPENSVVGILGVQLLDDTGEVVRSCARFPTTALFISKMLGLNRIAPAHFPDHFYTEWDHKDSRPVDQVIGAYFFVRGQLFQSLAGFDERFFVYFEEVDFSLRAKQAGFSSYFLASATCYHKGCGSSDQIKARRLFYSLRSRILYGFKNLGGISAIALLLATLFVEPLVRIAQALAHASLTGVSEVAHGYWMLWTSLPAMFRMNVETNRKSAAATRSWPTKMGRPRKSSQGRDL
jgi:N-acetylglucosaminyl-diphospho-decaprenol L-rhamnosyltransferase